jgi:hypothetical protein
MAADPIIYLLGHLLLVSCGIPVETAKCTQISDALKLLRREMKSTEDDCLVICVDKIIELDVRNNPQVYGGVNMTLAQKLMSDSMLLQDAAKGKLFFLSSHLLWIPCS